MLIASGGGGVEVVAQFEPNHHNIYATTPFFSLLLQDRAR